MRRIIKIKVDENIIVVLFKQRLPQKPMRGSYASEVEFEECYGYWMSHYGRILGLIHHIRN